MGRGWGGAEDRDSLATIRRAIDLGIALIFTYSLKKLQKMIQWPNETMNNFFVVVYAS